MKIPTWGYVAAAGLVVGGIWLYERSKGKSTETEGEEAYPVNSEGTPYTVESGGGGGGAAAASEVGLAEARGALGAIEAKDSAQAEALNTEITSLHEQVTSLSGTRASALGQLEESVEVLKALGVPVGGGTSAPANQQASPSTTNSSNSESGSHMPASAPAVKSSTVQALEARPGGSQNWTLNSTPGSPGAGHYYYTATGREQGLTGAAAGQSVHVYAPHAVQGVSGFVGKYKNLVVI